MNKINISQTKKAKAEYQSPIIDILLERSTKEELMKILHCSERAARNIISGCSMHYPIIANSKTPGYRRAKPIDDLDAEELEKEICEVDITINELMSRIKILKRKLKPLIAWKKVAERRMNKFIDVEK